MKGKMKGIYPHGAGFQAKFRKMGHSKIGTFATYEAAEVWMLECLAAVKAGRPLPEPLAGTTKAERTDTIQSLAEKTDNEFWSGNPECRSPTHLSRNAYLFASWVGPNTLVADALTKEKIEGYLQHLEAKGRAGGTANRHRSSILKMAGYAWSMGLIKAKPMVQRRAENAGRDRVYSDAEELMILKTVKAWGYEDHWALFAFLADTGCRLGETSRMPWSAWHSDHVLEIPSHYTNPKTGKRHKLTKSGKGRLIGLGDQSLAALKLMKAKYGHLPGPFWWHKYSKTNSLWKRIRAHLDFLGDDAVIHCFRHTFASRMVEETDSLDKVQRWLGHANPVTTQRYAKYSPTAINEVREIMARRNARERKELGDGGHPLQN